MKIMNKEIELLCWFDREGVPNPLRLRLDDESGQQQVIRIEHVLTRDLEKLAGNKSLIYTCQSTINGEQKLMTLKYELESCRWTLYKL